MPEMSAVHSVAAAIVVSICHENIKARSRYRSHSRVLSPHPGQSSSSGKSTGVETLTGELTRYMLAMKMETSRNARGTTTHNLCFVICTRQGVGLSIWLDLVSEVLRTFQHLRRSDTSQTVQIRPFRNRSAQTMGLVD
jgi:hypothetical protein